MTETLALPCMLDWPARMKTLTGLRASPAWSNAGNDNATAMLKILFMISPGFDGFRPTRFRFCAGRTPRSRETASDVCGMPLPDRPIVLYGCQWTRTIGNCSMEPTLAHWFGRARQEKGSSIMNMRLIAILAGAAVLCPAAAFAQDKKPNIVIILADYLGYGDLGCYNKGSKIPTPNLDKLATQGMRFTDAHSPSAVCSPTRYGLLTGRYPFRSPLKKGVVAPWGAPIIEQDRLTLPEMLRRAGYRTACIGKWHLGWTWATKDGKAAASGKDS